MDTDDVVSVYNFCNGFEFAAIREIRVKDFPVLMKIKSSSFAGETPGV